MTKRSDQTMYSMSQMLNNFGIQDVIQHQSMSQSQPPRLLNYVRQSLRLYYSLKTKKSYVYYIRDFILHNKRHSKEMRADEIKAYLSRLAIERKRGSVNLDFGTESLSLYSSFAN